MSEIGQIIAERMNALRRQHRISLQGLADKTGVSKSHLWDLAHGNSVNPTIGTTVAVASALGVSLDYLCGLSSSTPNLHPEALRIACEIDALIRRGQT